MILNGKVTLVDYGYDKFDNEMYLKEHYRQYGFPATIIMPGQILNSSSSLGKSFDAKAATHITLYIYNKHLYDYFGQISKNKFMLWSE
ncbi:hypothetical protein U3516DRAFT_769239 [Neocallimastix sp. 'constans']